jgi:hypothetical protein
MDIGILVAVTNSDPIATHHSTPAPLVSEDSNPKPTMPPSPSAPLDLKTTHPLSSSSSPTDVIDYFDDSVTDLV